MSESSSADAQQLPAASGRAVALRLWTMLAGRRLLLCAVVALFLIEAAAALVFPLVIGFLVDVMIGHQGSAVPSVFWWLLGLLVTAALTAGTVTWLAGLALARLSETVIAELRESYVWAALNLPRATIEEAGTGDVVTRASDDIARISGTLPQVLPRVCVSIFTIVLVLGGLGALNPWYLTGFALTVPLYAITARWYLRTAPQVYAAERAVQSERGQEILSTLTDLPTVAAHQLEPRQLGLIRGLTWQSTRWAMRTRIVQNRLFGRLNITQALGLLAILGIAVGLSVNGSTTPGQATAAALLFLRTVAPIEALLFVMDDLQSALASLGRVIGILPTEDRPKDPTRHDGVSPISPGETLVALDEVHFSYGSGPAALTAVNLHVQRGQVLAVVGATASGKSTLASLIAGVHRPGAGGITSYLSRERIVTVTQESHVFTGTVRENLALADPEATDARIVSALQRVGAEHIVAALPGGLDTPVGDGGHTLTATTVQHLALARLVLADPELVILDEATAEADSADTDRLEAAARAAVTGRTAVVIAHRLSQAAQADHVIVLDSGRIVEAGGHSELIAQSGAYARLWEAWTA